jgi:hypothetical protein
VRHNWLCKEIAIELFEGVSVCCFNVKSFRVALLLNGEAEDTVKEGFQLRRAVPVYWVSDAFVEDAIKLSGDPCKSVIGGNCTSPPIVVHEHAPQPHFEHRCL